MILPMPLATKLISMLRLSPAAKLGPTLLVSATLAAALLAAPASHAEAQAPQRMALSDALATLEQQSLTLAQAWSRAEEAEGVVRQARSALLPNLSASGAYTRNSAEAKIALGNILPVPGAAAIPPIVIQPLEAWTAGGALRVPLFMPTAWYDLSATQHAARAAHASADMVRLQVRTTFAQVAYATSALEEIVTASERAIGTATEHAESATRRVQAGTAAPLDSLRARTEVVRRESDLVRARADVARAQLGLAVLLGRTQPVRIEVTEMTDNAVQPSVTGQAVTQAVATRPDRIAAEAQQDVASAQRRSAWARLLPQLAATGSVFASDVPYPTGKKEGWRVTVELTWPLYDGGYRYGKDQQAQAALRTANLASEATRLTILQELEDAKRDLEVARERLRLAGEQQKLASDAASSAKRSFDAGVASNLDVLDANDRLYQSDVAMADGRARFAQAVWSLERALGRSR